LPKQESQSQIAPHLFVILGATGDLTGRKLLPALHHLAQQDKLGPRSYVLGAAIDTDLDDKTFRARARKWLVDDGESSADLGAEWCDQKLFYQTIGRGGADDYRALAGRIAGIVPHAAGAWGPAEANRLLRDLERDWSAP
jgi:glucose-6-phosphate 1-dehydrogenase